MAKYTIKTIKPRYIQTRKGIDIGGIYTKIKSKTTKIKYKVMEFRNSEVILHSNKKDTISGKNYTKYQWSIKSFHKDFKRVG